MSGLSIHLVSIRGFIAEIPFWAYASLAGLLLLLLCAALFLLRKKAKMKSTPKRSSAKVIRKSPKTPDSNLPLLKTFEQLNGTLRTVLLAAASIEDLPVTVPIQLAIQLTQKGKCLLIDFDSKRDSIAKVFELNSSKGSYCLKPTPIETAVDNLDLWPARFFDQLRFINLRQLLDVASQKYEYILLYAPYLPVLPDRKHIASCSKQAIVFSKTEDDPSPLYDLLKAAKCRVVGPPEL